MLNSISNLMPSKRTLLGIGVAAHLGSLAIPTIVNKLDPYAFSEALKDQDKCFAGFVKLTIEEPLYVLGCTLAQYLCAAGIYVASKVASTRREVAAISAITALHFFAKITNSLYTTGCNMK